MNCKIIQFLMSLYIADDLILTTEERLTLVNHLQNCQKCAREYEQSKFIIDIAREHWQISKDTLALIERLDQSDKRRMTVEEGWEDLKYRIPELNLPEKRRKRLKLLRRVGTVAACLAISVFVYLMLPDPTTPEKPLPLQTALAPVPSIRIQILSDEGDILIPAGQQIASMDLLKTLVINEKHQIVLNSDTTVTIEPLAQNNREGCLVKLASGQIHAHVEHDGNPFIVVTPNGRAVITGTSFDLKVTDAGTTLVVVDGNVKFESEKGAVDVSAGQISKIITRSYPTKPVSCNVKELTAWATTHEQRPALVKVQSISDDYGLTELWLSVISEPIELENINYEDWVEEKQSWFRREFPWIFQFQSALAAEGIRINYPELLISSGDIWQFVYPETSPYQIPILHFGSQLKAASKYGFDEQWLTTNIHAATLANDDPVVAKDRFTSLQAFEAWANCFENLQKSQTPPHSRILLYSVHACVYLANTRILAGLSLMNGDIGLPAEDKAKVLALLKTEVNTVYELAGHIMRLFVAPEDQSCDECWSLLDGIIEDINTIVSIEEGFLKYEMIK